MKMRWALRWAEAAVGSTCVRLLLVAAVLCATGVPGSAAARAPGVDLSQEPEPASVVLAQGTIFPDVEGGFNGMKISYTVTGAMLGVPDDWSSYRTHNGRLGTGTLTVSGWVEQKGGYGASMSVSLDVGEYDPSNPDKFYQSSGGNPWRHDFSLSLPIPVGETRGRFGILMIGDYNAGSRYLSVNGEFDPKNPVPVTLTGQAYTPLTHVNGTLGLPAAVQASKRAPLANVGVDLVRVEKDAQDKTVYRKLAGSMADADGNYWFRNVPVTTSLAISASLLSGDLAVYDASASPANYNPLPTPATVVYAVTQPFNVAGDKDLTVDVAFDSGGSLTYPPPGSQLRQRLEHFGLIYYHTWQAVFLAQLLGVDVTTRPMPVYAYLPDVKGAYWRGPGSDGGNPGMPPHIAVGANPTGGVSSSHASSANRPDNREWHEYGHHLMADAFSDLMPRDGLPRKNHDGYKNESTSDSWTEGFAEFYSLLVNREIAKDGTPPHLYDWAGGASSLEANWRSWTFRGAQSFEEFAVASLLWDLLDPADNSDISVLVRSAGEPAQGTYADRVEVDLPKLWEVLSYNRGGAYGYNLHMQHLYDALKAKGIGTNTRADGMTALDELFVAHGFFADTGANVKFYNAGETVGSTGYLGYMAGNTAIPTRNQRNSPPPVPDAYVRVSVVDEDGKPVELTQFDVDVRFQSPFQAYNFSYVAMAKDNRLFFLPAPLEYPATISVTPKGRTADAPLVLTNEFVWTAPADGDGIIKTHTFVVSSRSSVYVPMVAKMSGAPAPVRSDDFCNSGSGWPVGDRATYSLHYLAGPPCVYQIRITEDNNLAAATPGWQGSDFTLESLVRLDTVNPGGAGLLFGVSSDWTRFSVFGIGNNGKYWLSTYQQGGWTRVVPSTVTDKINLNGENRLRVVSDGTRFAIYLNDYGLANVDDGASHAGRMGLYAEGLAGFDARFRAVKLWNDSITPADEAGPAGEWQGAGALMD